MRIFTVIGARPQFIKAAALSRELKNYRGVEELIVHTGQHFDAQMSDVFFEEMDIPTPRHNLKINSLSHGAMTGRMLEGLERLMIEEKPDMVLVYGDTNSTIAGALAASKLHIPIGHVEAGLRSFSMGMPEEVNRILTDRVSNYLFCPTQTAVDNLYNEGFRAMDNTIVLSGDVMQDAALFYAKTSAERSKILAQLGSPGNFCLATLHRAENTDDELRLKSIIQALNELHDDYNVICPLHPRTKKLIASLNIDVKFSIIDPVGYFDMVELLKHCKMVLTDSGGLQKEAYFFSKPCITMRDQTEWTELVENGYNIIVGAEKNKILEGVSQMTSVNLDFSDDLYGGGKASKAIADVLTNRK